MTDIITCTVCRRAGAQWMLQVGSNHFTTHKPCGTRVCEQAPEGVTAKVYPSPALREQWAKERRERDAQNFWAEKFQEAGLKKAGTSGGPLKSTASLSP